MQRTLLTFRLPYRRAFSTTTQRFTAWSPGPAPPRLPKSEQEIFEQLQRESTGAFSTPRKTPQINQSPQSEPQVQADTIASQQQMRQTPEINQSPATSEQSTEQQLNAKVKTGDGEELHPNIRRGAAPEFEGEINPNTGEAGGPKNEPLRWGHESDWSYNGRVTDF